MAIRKPLETNEHYCPICGKDVTDQAFKRFGEWACSEEHGEQYVKEVRAERAQAPSGPPSLAAAEREHSEEHADRRDDDRYAARPSPWGWFGRRGGCC